MDRASEGDGRTYGERGYDHKTAGRLKKEVKRNRMRPNFSAWAEREVYRDMSGPENEMHLVRKSQDKQTKEGHTR